MTKTASLKDFRYIRGYALWSIVILRVSAAFFNTGVILAYFNMNGKLDFSIESLKFETKTLANMFAFSLTTFVGILVSWQARKFSTLRFHSGFRIFELLKRKEVVFGFYYRPLLLQVHCWRLQFEYHSIFQLLTILTKRVFKISAVLLSPIIISSFSINRICHGVEGGDLVQIF